MMSMHTYSLTNTDLEGFFNDVKDHIVRHLARNEYLTREQAEEIEARFSIQFKPRKSFGSYFQKAMKFVGVTKEQEKTWKDADFITVVEVCEPYNGKLTITGNEDAGFSFSYVYKERESVVDKKEEDQEDES